MKLALAALSVAALAQAQSSVDPPDFVPTQLQAPLLEQFTDSWEERWSPSHATKKSPVGSGETFSYVGVWSVEEPTVYPGFKGDKGLVMKSKAAHHAISAPVPGGLKVADGRPLVVQYETKLQKGLECGGAYMKLLSEDPAASGEEFSDKTPFTIMFGPDKCGATNKVHFIFRHRHPVTGEYEEKHLEATPSPKITKTTALYTLIVNPDDTFEIKINDESVQTGSLASSFLPAVHPPRTIADPSSTKPSTWVDDETIPDPDAVKPADWDEEAPALIVDPTATMPEGWLVDEPPTVADPEAVMPDEWDEEEDGDWLAPSVPNPLCEEAPGCGPWTAPRIPNPAFKGVWTAPRVPNPAFVGVWQPEQVPNPAFFEPGPIATGLDDIQSVGLELWTMTDDMLFDNIYLGHSVADAEALAQETFHRKLALERAAETLALEDEEEDEREQVKKLTTDGTGKGIGGVVGRAVGAVKGRFDETIETFPHFVELLKDDWRAALATYPTFITTVAASILALVTLFSTLLALLSESPKPAVATTTTHTKPTTASKKRVVEGVELAPVVLEAEVVVPPAVAGGAGGEQGKSSAVEVGGDGGEIKVRKTTTTTTAK